MKKLLLILLSSSSMLAIPENLTFEFKYGSRSSIEAFVGNQKAGFVSFDLGSSEAYISHLLVHSDFRKQGIGTALMQEAMKFFENNNYTTIRLWASPWDTGPRLSKTQLLKFYGKFGFKIEYGTHMIKGDFRPRKYYYINFCNQVKNITLCYIVNYQTHPYITAAIATSAVVSAIEYKTGFIRKQIIALKNKLLNNSVSKASKLDIQTVDSVT